MISDVQQIFQPIFYPDESEEAKDSNLTIFLCKETADGHFVVETKIFESLNEEVNDGDPDSIKIFDKLTTIPPIYEYLLDKKLSIDLVSFENTTNPVNSENINTYFIAAGPTKFYPNVNFNIIAYTDTNTQISYNSDTNNFLNFKKTPTNEEVYRTLYNLNDDDIDKINNKFLKQNYNEEDQLFFDYMSDVLNVSNAFGAASGVATSGAATSREKDYDAAKENAKKNFKIPNPANTNYKITKQGNKIFHGIYNYNSQCYLSSVIQLFARIPEFEEYLRTSIFTEKHFTRIKGIQRPQYSLETLVNSILNMFDCVKGNCANQIVGFLPSQAIRKMDQALPLDNNVYGRFGETDSIIEMFAWEDTFLDFFNRHITKISLPYFTSIRLNNHEKILNCYFSSIGSADPCYEFQEMYNVVYNNTTDKDPRESVQNTNYLLVTINRLPTALPTVILDKQRITLQINGNNITYELVGVILGSGGHFVFVDYSNFINPMLFDDSRAIPFNRRSNLYFYSNRFRFISQLLYKKVDRARGGRRRKTFRISRRKKLRFKNKSL